MTSHQTPAEIAEREADKLLTKADSAVPDHAVYLVQRALVFELRAFRYQVDARLERTGESLATGGIVEQLREIDSSIVLNLRP